MAVILRKKKLSKVYRTVQELGIQAFTEQSSGKFIGLFRINCKTYKNFSWMFRIVKNVKKVDTLSRVFKVTCLITCLLLYWPKIHRIFFISHYFGIGSDSFCFLRLKFSLLNIKLLKQKARQTFRPHMGALFSAINSRINSKFL